MVPKYHPKNPSLLLLDEGMRWWNAFPVQYRCGRLIEHYLWSICLTMKSAVLADVRVMGCRFDLKLPRDYGEVDSSIISRFFASLKAQLDAVVYRKSRAGKRIYSCRVRYVWVKERDTSEHCHYHVCIFLNHDAYFTLGRLKSASEVVEMASAISSDGKPRLNLADRITKAWASALGLRHEEAIGLVNFPNNPVYRIDRNSAFYKKEFDDVFYRLSYFAKVDTKNFGDGTNNFGCSRIEKGLMDSKNPPSILLPHGLGVLGGSAQVETLVERFDGDGHLQAGRHS